MIENGQKCPNCNETLQSLTAVYCPNCGMVLKGSQKDLDQSRIVMLFQQAEKHIENEEWTEGIYLLIDALRLDPENKETQQRVRVARQQYRLARLYEWAEEHYFARNFPAALQNLHEIEEVQPDYRNVNKMIEDVEKEAFQKSKKTIRKLRRNRFFSKLIIALYYFILVTFVTVLVVALLMFFSALL